MKKLLPFLLITLSTASLYAQDCSYPLFKFGTRLLFETTYATSEKRQTEILSGSTVKQNGGNLAITHFAYKKMTGEITWQTDSLEFFCRNDTFYQIPVNPKTLLTDNSIVIQDATAIPTNMRVGDSLPPYTMTTITFLPKLSVERRQIIKQNYRTDYDIYRGSMINSTTIPWQISKEDIDNTLFSLNVWGDRYVLRMEKVQTPLGEKDAFVITSTLKTQTDLKINDPAIQQRINRAFEKSDNKLKKKGDNADSRANLVQTIEEWYVPYMGFVKQVVKDAQGKVLSEMILVDASLP